MVEKSVPKMEREIRWKAGESGDEVRFESVDGLFCRVCSVIIRGNELETNVVVFNFCC